MPSADRLQEFARVVDAGSISAAARALDLPRATLSRRLSALEEELSVRLLHRSTRRLVLTPAGEELFRRARRIVADTDEAWRTVRRLDDQPRGRLCVSVVGPLFVPLLVDFLRDYEEVSLEVRETSRHVDLIAEGVDVAMRFGTVKDQNLVARRLFKDRNLVVGAPSYFERRGVPRTVEDLADHECFVGFAGDLVPSWNWALRDGGTVRVSGRLASNAINVIHHAARAGLGLALLPGQMVAPDLAAGLLVPALVDEVGAETGASIVYAEREYIDPKVRVFVDRVFALLGTQS